MTGKGLPKEYEVAFLCDNLKLSNNELNEQPMQWVHDMIDYLEQKGKAEDHKMRLEKAKMKNKKR